MVWSCHRWPLETAVAKFNEEAIVPIAVSLSDVPHYIAEFSILLLAAWPIIWRVRQGRGCSPELDRGMTLINKRIPWALSHRIEPHH